MADNKNKIKELEKELDLRDEHIDNLITKIEMYKRNEEVLKDIIILLNKQMLGI